MEKLIIWINSNNWFVSLLSLILGAIITSFLAKKKDVLMKIAEKKSEYYAGYFNALFEFGNPNVHFMGI